MDSALAVAAAVAIAGTVASLLQERFFGRLDGNTARVASIITAVLIGAAAVAKTGGFVLVATPAPDLFDVAASILANATLVLIASQAAFRVLVKPVAN